jgi:uncharacterized protein with PQ loop repeat
MRVELLNATDYSEKNTASIDLTNFTFVNVIFVWVFFSFLLSLYVWSQRPAPVFVLSARCEKSFKKLR